MKSDDTVQSILNFGNQAYKHRTRFSPEPLAVGTDQSGTRPAEE